ncbi:hypothetical protein ACH5RR_036416 [Cinchona calisaya]|uniref:Uncharacterized protein n=1 Tax=Cinchona calisaya TaxID=153742 RepID=A0ABD2Y6B4_9GENT
MVKTSSIQSILVVILFAIAIALSFPNIGLATQQQVVETVKKTVGRKLLQDCVGDPCKVDADCTGCGRCIWLPFVIDHGACLPIPYSNGE